MEKSDKCPWYKGWSANINPKTVVTGFTLLDALDNLIVPPKRQPTAPLRISIDNVYNIEGTGQIFGGTVVQGTLKPNDAISFINSGIKDKTVLTIEQHHERIQSAGPGSCVGLSIKGISADEKVQHGDVIYMQKEGVPKPVKSFTAQVSVHFYFGRA